MVAKTRSAQAGVAVGVGVADRVGKDVGDGAAADPHAEPVATANERIVASHQRVIRAGQRGKRLTSEKGQAPLEGGLGEREGKRLGDTWSSPSHSQSVLKPALRTVHDVGDNREIFRRVRKADPTGLVRRTPKHGE